ncbi:MAG: PorT family protein [Bacteroidales bacterium]|nr:PorT family protein [Bacteroidales bacterium]
MKKILSVALVAVLLLGASVNAQARSFQDRWFHFGVKGGVTFTQATMTDFSALKNGNFTGFNAGLIFDFQPLKWLDIQPEILYVNDGMNLTGELEGIKLGNVDWSEGSIRIPINLQFGLPLLNGNIKPYIVAAPYFGFKVHDSWKSGSSEWMQIKEGNTNVFQFGIGVGAGIQLWRFQVAFKWNFAITPVFTGDVAEALKDTFGSTKLSGGEVTLGILIF